MKRSLGTCYYPEHWSPELWPNDAQRMAEAGLTWVRIGEFAWSRLEPKDGAYDFEWLDQVIEILGSAGLKIVLGTPTATPPRWMIDKHPDMLAVDENGHLRKFGSRRHYCFSHEGYREECARIVGRLAVRYGNNPFIGAWQTDNEYGCHNTTFSYSQSACKAFRQWCKKKYSGSGNDGNISALNTAWGNIFWSMEYSDFDQINLPNLTVTEGNPAHRIAFSRFTSEQVLSFNKLQVDIIRKYSNAPITHNFMGRITDFDHFSVGADLDIASWNSYPLGFLEDRVDAPADHQRNFARQGDPDFQAFHHDLYRAVGQGRWWIMEQQPGPVNWAPYNPEPLPGMVRLWTWEAFAHGAETVNYFRWRQAPMAQEQMHSGLLRPDNEDAPALEEVKTVARELETAGAVKVSQASVAIIFDYDADSAWHIQPHGKRLSYFGLVFDIYRALRSLGLSIDICPPTQRNFEGYYLIIAPGLIHVSEELKLVLKNASGKLLLGPRTAARDENMSIPVPLPPNMPDFDVTVARVESLRPDMPVPLDGTGCVVNYREVLEGSVSVRLKTHDGMAVAVSHGNITYLGAWLDQCGFAFLLKPLCDEAGLETFSLPVGVRRRTTDNECFWFNFTQETVAIAGLSLKPLSVLRQTIK